MVTLNEPLRRVNIFTLLIAYGARFFHTNKTRRRKYRQFEKRLSKTSWCASTMGLLCSKCSLKRFEARKSESSEQAKGPIDGTIEIRKGGGGTEKATHFGSKFTRRKVAKSRPVISTPRPVNPLHLNGRKWRHVIVTIPVIDEPPVRPARKKRKPSVKKGDTMELGRVNAEIRHPDDDIEAKKMSFFEIMNVLQLRRCLRVLGTGFDGSSRAEPPNGKHEVDEQAAVPDDLFFTFLHGKGNETAIMVFATASLPFNIDYTKNRSLTNEPNDSFFDNANVCGCAASSVPASYRFKKNFILLQTAVATSPDQQPASKRDLDKLKFCEICQPRAPFQHRRINANCIEIRASRDNAKNEPPSTCSCPTYVFVTRNINRRVVSITSSSSPASPPRYHRHQHQQQSNSLNVKNISNKTNQKPNNMYSSSSTNIEKVSNKMKKILDENVSLSSPSQALVSIAFSSSTDCRNNIRKNHLTSGSATTMPLHSSSHHSNTLADDVARLNFDCCMKNCIQDDDRDSDTSCTDSLTEFTYSLGT